eukprot:403338055
MNNKQILFATLLLFLGSSISTATSGFLKDTILEPLLKNGRKPVLYRTSQFGENQDRTNTPVIGIISQTLETEMQNLTEFQGYKSYIMKSYVDFVESAGARVVPLVVGEPEEVTLQKLQKLNGVVFPGGDGDYLEYGRYVFNAIKEFNDNGTFYPLWGTCMGYENIVSYVSDNGWNVLDVYDYDSGSMALEFVVDPRQSKMFAGLDEKAFLFESYNVTYNAHHWGMNPEKFQTDKGLMSIFKHTAISYMPDGRPFVASIESDQYPFFGSQFHPEKVSRVFKEELNVDHSWLSIGLNRHFSDYFVHLTRQNTNNYGNYSQTQKDIIENHHLIVSDDWYDSVYVFE